MKKTSMTAVLTAAMTLALSINTLAFTLSVGWKSEQLRGSTHWHYDKTGYGNFAVNEWLWIDSDNDGIAQCYYFDSTSFMWANREKDGYTLNENGQWTVDGVVQTKTVEINNSEPVDLQKAIDERKGQKKEYRQVVFSPDTINEDKATGYTNAELFDPVFKYHEYSRYDKLSNTNMTILRYKGIGPYSIYYSFKGNEAAGNMLKPEEEQAVQEAIDKFLSAHIYEGMTDSEKVDNIVQFMMERIEYDHHGTAHNSNVYGGLINGKVTCDGYTDTFSWLANASGLETLRVHGKVTGSKLPHAWNLVKIDGNWYHVDTTWEDGNPGKYVNLTDTEMSKDHKWEQRGLPECN